MPPVFACLLLPCLLVPSVACAHAGHHAVDLSHESKKAAGGTRSSAFAEINADYALHVKAVFEEKCASCHSAAAPAPWYARVPLVGGWIEDDRTEAKKHLEISRGFPFAGHGTPQEDLTALRETVGRGTMPPGLYRIVHPLSRLSGDEKAAVLRWLDHADLLLKP